MRRRTTQRLPSMSASVLAVTGTAGEDNLIAVSAPLTKGPIIPKAKTQVTTKSWSKLRNHWDSTPQRHSGDYADEVRAEEQQYQAMGIQPVTVIIFNRRYLVTDDQQPRGIGCPLLQRMQVLLDRINFSFAGRDTVVGFETGA